MAELMFQDNELIVSKTDTKGNILYGNELFLKLAGYTEQELLRSPHNIIRHPKMPKVIFKLLWETVQQGKEINAYVMNRAKNGDHYWVLANVTPSYDANKNIVGFYSVRRKPTKKALDVIIPLYEQLYQAEKSGGINASQKILDSIIAENGGRYDRFILSL
ncbi:PAS domain-containing protein [Sulfurimonas sp. C5]|uniref:PAS domain-containing protein n=1 Tax=Sulfurimonas sp. C5 TaxID=3036947 RepID=UPI002456514A|nr:PAS domain-containing protein [Sulfurimonas sp. C5]MDH4944699.1 PAS domain-containing protein [Sulfurimonas sp. C5]